MMRRIGLAGMMLVILYAVPAGRLQAEPDPQKGKAAFAFDQAIQNYLKGDSQKAIQQLDESLSLDSSNQRAKVFLLKILVERGSRLFLSKQYPKAYEYLSRAYHMDPSNDQVRQMFDLAAKQVKPKAPVTQVMLIPKGMEQEMLKQEAENQVRQQGVPDVTLAQAPAQSQTSQRPGSAALAAPGYAAAAPLQAQTAPVGNAVAGTTPEDYTKNVTAMISLLATFQDRQERQLSQFMAPLERIQNLYYQSEQDRKNFVNQLDAKFSSVLGDVSFQQRMVIYGFIAGLLMLGVVVWGFFMVVGRMRSKREETIMKYQQEMLKMVRDMAGLPGANPYAALPPASAGGGWALPGAAPYLIPGAVAAPVLNSAPGVAMDLATQLEAKTRVGNYKERAQAAMQILSINAEKGAEIIKTLIIDPDPFLRESMAMALGDLYHPLTQNLLLECLRDNERRVVAAAERSIRRLEQLPEEMMPASARASLQQAIQGAASPGRLKKKSRGAQA